MALVNRHMKYGRCDEEQLLLNDDKIKIKIEDDDDYTEVERFRHHGTALWKSDAFLLILTYLQVYAVFVDFSEYWGWPLPWVQYTQFALLANFDVWEILMVQKGHFNNRQSPFFPVSSFGFSYSTYVAVWLAILLLVVTVFSASYIRLVTRGSLYLLLRVAGMRRVAFVLIQVFSLPLGIVFARIYQCHRDTSQQRYVLVVDAGTECYTGAHYAAMTFFALLLGAIFVIIPAIIYSTVGEYAYCSSGVRHEAYLQLKEAEYERGLDILWSVGSFHLFSSFTRKWSRFRAFEFVVKLVVILSFAMSFHDLFWCTFVVTLLFGLVSMAFLCRRPFRVGSFNSILILSTVSLTANALVGNFLVVPPWESSSRFVIVSFLRSPTIVYVLAAINLYWIMWIIIWIGFLILRDRRIVGSAPIWPKLSHDEKGVMGPHTKRFMRAVLSGRQALERALSSLPMFAPIHELSDQIQMVNACCREAEYLGDASHDTLWDLLDELIEAHNSLMHRSVFGLSGKSTLGETAATFLKIMPAFAKRLQQREHDLILVNPKRRRMLLKLYVVGVFVNGRREKVLKRSDLGLRITEFLKRYGDDGGPLSDDAVQSSSVADTRPTTSSGSLSLDAGDVNGPKSQSMNAFIERLESWTSEHPRTTNSPTLEAFEGKESEADFHPSSKASSSPSDD